MLLNVSSEELYQLFDAALDAVVAMRADGIVAAWSKQAEILFGWRHDEAVGRSLASLIIPHELRDAHWRGLEHFLATGEGPLISRRIDVRALHKDGRVFPVELTILPLHKGERLTFFAFARAARRRVDLSAEIMLPEHHTLKCCVVDCSSIGARLAIASAFGLPGAFRLRVGGRALDVQIVRRGIGHVAVTFA